MDAFTKLTTITALVSEIITMNKDKQCLNAVLDFIISHLHQYKDAPEEDVDRCCNCGDLFPTITDENGKGWCEECYTEEEEEEEADIINAE